jgi:putative metalloprotease
LNGEAKILRKLFVSMICVFVISASAPGAHALDLEGMLGAAVDAFKAVTLSDAEVRNMAAAAKKEMDSKNKLAPPTDAQAIRLARITRGISLDRGLRPDIKLYLAPDVNAFAMADGTIRVYSGLMKAMTDDEVATSSATRSVTSPSATRKRRFRPPMPPRRYEEASPPAAMR